jgi:acyl dehydratase
MPVDSFSEGATFPVEAGHIMMFARAVGDANPIYHDEAYAKQSEAGGIVAPPTFAWAGAHFDPDYSLRPEIGEPWFGSGAEPSGTEGNRVGSGGGTGLHGEQHFEYHRPMRPGDVLTSRVGPGRRWEKQGRRGGTLSFDETVTEYYDQHGELVVTARYVGVRTGRLLERD